MNAITDHLASRQRAGLGNDLKELNDKLEAIARNFSVEWLDADGDNPLQKLWKRRDALATNELLNFGDAIEGFEKVDESWLSEKVQIVKSGDEGNRSGAIFELLGLNTFLFAGNNVIPAKSSNPGYDGTVTLNDGSSWLVSIKNHGMTSYHRFFQKNAKEVDGQFQRWLAKHSASGTELRIFAQKYLDATAWGDVKSDLRHILDGQLDGTARNYKPKGKAQIILENLSNKYQPLGEHNISSVTFIAAKAHKNEQDKFLEDIRKGCSNLVKHTKNEPNSACPVLFVRLCANASVNNCKSWADDYFKQFPNERVGLIILYQATIVTSESSSSLAHYILPIEGPQFSKWRNPPGHPQRALPNMGVLVGVILGKASRKVIVADDGRQIELDDTYLYQRGDIYRRYVTQGGTVSATLSNPAPGIKIHAEIDLEGHPTGVQMIAPESGELQLLT
ncbi:hypothetical protein C5688_08715 [Methylocystis sp. MitZ-2018]|nr:hypothetical protein C5688_08715 [Methylocystis sp. MitZ-2018]